MFCNPGVSTNLGLNILIGINCLAGTPNLYLFVYYVYLLWSSCMLRFSQPMDRLGHLTLESLIQRLDYRGLENRTPGNEEV